MSGDPRVEALRWNIPKNEWDREEMPVMPTSLLLERGGPWEVLPRHQAHYAAEAREYIADTFHPQEARRRVREVWLEGKFRAAWEKGQPEEDMNPVDNSVENGEHAAE